MSKTTRKPTSRKAADRPKKPYPDYPLYAHPLGYWSKKIRGKIQHFGRWGRQRNGKMERLPGDGWQDALNVYKAQCDDLYAGRTPRTKKGELTIGDLCNQFLTAKLRKVESGELGHRSFSEYKATTDLIVAGFGSKRLVDDLAADDFGSMRATMTEKWGPVRLGNVITRVKSVFKFGIDNGLIEKAIRYGSEFNKPGKATLRKHKAANGQKMFEADECRQLIDAAEPQMRAMILLALNAGFGNSDCSGLPLSAVDLDRGWIVYPRPKTGIDRRCPLWPETVAALRDAIAARPEPKSDDEAGLVFLTVRGTALVRVTEKSKVDNVAIQFGELAKRVGIHKAGCGFYVLRHVHRTVSDGARDPVACDLIMGHSDGGSMAGHYRERIDDSRLIAVAEHVRQWLFCDTPDDDGGTDEPDTETDATTDEPQTVGAYDHGGPATLKLYSPENESGVSA